MIRLAITALMVSGVFVGAEPLPMCIADIVIRQSGKVATSNADTLMTLGMGKSVAMTVKVFNRGKVPNLALVLKPEGVDVASGGLTRNISLASSASGSREVTVQGKDLGNNCHYGSRLLRVEIRPQGELKGDRICGEAVVRFTCENSEIIAVNSQAQEAIEKSQTVRQDTVWKVQPQSLRPAVKAARRDTVREDVTSKP